VRLRERISRVPVLSRALSLSVDPPADLESLRRAPRDQRRRIVVGASGLAEPGWLATDQHFLDLLVAADWERWLTRARSMPFSQSTCGST